MKSKTNVVIIDSNFILLPFQFKVDYFLEIRQMLEGKVKFIIFQQILNELNSKKGKQQKATKFNRFLQSGLLYLERNNKKYQIEILEEIKNEYETTDDFLLKKAIVLNRKGNNVYLATNDSELRKKAHTQHINTIFLRQKKYLTID
ncbi:MAG: PIN domain-containing protein [Candidatus Odinarchaeota archaeon]